MTISLADLTKLLDFVTGTASLRREKRRERHIAFLECVAQDARELAASWERVYKEFVTGPSASVTFELPRAGRGMGSAAVCNIYALNRLQTFYKTMSRVFQPPDSESEWRVSIVASLSQLIASR